MFHRFVIADSERGLVFVDGVLRRFLEPGAHRLFFPFSTVTLRKVSVLEPKLEMPDAELLATSPVLAGKVLTVRVKDTERGLVFKDGNFARFLTPGFHAFVLGGPKIGVELVDITGLKLEHPLRDVLIRQATSAQFLRMVDVPEGHRGVLFIDHVREGVLAPGRYVYWNGFKDVVAQIVELREQTLEVQGQELMTQDKVSLRVNMTVRFQVADPVLALSGQANWRDAFYRDLQLSLRDEIGARSLDELLARKDQIGTAVVERVKPLAATMGLELLGAGLRDLILPGEMRTIFNQVIEAEKRAQASLISRREETAATRNLLNTAKLMEGNPTLLRLKELEAAAQIAEKVGTLSVVGGLDGLMKQLSGFVHLNGDSK
jgi:regulator of protease activity HflC (stomatin/prohibitin superfamily)